MSADGGAGAGNLPQATFAAARLLNSSTLWLKLFLTLVAILAVLASYFFIVNDARLQARARAEENLRSVSFALAQHVERAIEQADQIGRVMRLQYLRGDKFDSFARLYKEIDPELYTQFGFLDPTGMSVFSTVPGSKPVDLSDRKHFRVQADAPGKDFLYISEPVIGRISKKLTLQLSRRVDSAAGKFLGVTVVSINPEEFTAVYRQLVGETGVVTLSGFDGINRIRVDKAGFTHGEDVSKLPWFGTIMAADHGSAEIEGSVDGIRRLMAFQQIPELSMYVTVQLSLAEIESKYLVGYLSYLPLLAGVIIGVVALLFAFSVRAQVLNLRLEASNFELQKNVELAKLATQSKTQFFANMSHELRTPLHGILGHSQLLALDALPADAMQSADAIHQSAKHLLQIVNQVLDLSKAESGLQELEMESISIRSVFDEIIKLHAADAAHRGLALSLLFESGVPELVHTDGTLLKRILHNLVSNALKFTEKGGVTVRVSPRVSPDPQHILVEVTDTGRGISVEDQGRLFSSYTQIQNFETRSILGTGLGLSLSRQLVALLGGEIGLSSRPGEGSVFWFTLPTGPAGALVAGTPA